MSFVKLGKKSSASYVWSDVDFLMEILRKMHDRVVDCIATGEGIAF